MQIVFKTALALLFLLFMCTACEYELSGEYIHDINKPAPTHEGSISLSKGMDSIIIWEPTEISYSLNSFGLQCNGIQLEYLDTKITNQYNTSGKFTITPDFSLTDWFDLKANFYLGTGSGSIADRFKAENYVGSRTWKVRFMDITKFDYQYQFHINNDGFLELFWIKPSFVTGIYSSINEGSTIHPHISKIVGDTTFFVDSTYYGGNTQSYTLHLSLNSRTLFGNSIRPDYPFPVLRITPYGLDSTVVSWTKSSLKQYYKVYKANSNQQYFYTGYENSFRTKGIIGIEDGYYLEIYPYNISSRQLYNHGTVNTSYKIGDTANYKFHYSYVKNQFYIPSPYSLTQIEKVDITTPEGKAYANNGINKYELWGNHQGTRFVGFYNGDIHVFDESLTEVRKITICNPTEDFGGQMTDDNCFGFYNYNTAIYTMTNIGLDFSWQQFTFKPSASDESVWGNLRLSLDGKYAFWRGDKYFIIYDVSNHQNANIVYQCPNSEVYYAMGNPLAYNQVLISKTDKIELRSLPDYQLIRQIDLPGIGNTALLTVDTYSNSFLALSQNYFQVISLSSMKEVLRFGANLNSYIYYWARLHRNNFFFNGTRTDLTPYLAKP